MAIACVGAHQGPSEEDHLLSGQAVGERGSNSARWQGECRLEAKAPAEGAHRTSTNQSKQNLQDTTSKSQTERQDCSCSFGPLVSVPCLAFD